MMCRHADRDPFITLDGQGKTRLKLMMGMQRAVYNSCWVGQTKTRLKLMMGIQRAV